MKAARQVALLSAVLALLLVMAGTLPDPVSQCVDGGLEHGAAQCALLGVEAAARQFWTWRQAGGDRTWSVWPFSAYLYSLGVVTKDGKRRVLLVNKRDRAFDVTVSGASGGQMDYVDQSTAMNPPASARLTGDTLKVNGFGVAVVTLS
jgi:hypothetical protein